LATVTFAAKTDQDTSPICLCLCTLKRLHHVAVLGKIRLQMKNKNHSIK